MIVIKDMEMPSCCHWDCPLAREDGGACMLDAYDAKTDTKKERASDCPLVEIITCKDCKHNAYETKIKGSELTRIFCTKNKNYPCIDDFCADAERKE